MKNEYRNDRGYFVGNYDMIFHAKTKLLFSIGDLVYIMNTSITPATGVIQSIMRGNRGRGRYWAVIRFLNDELEKFPLGALRHI